MVPILALLVTGVPAVAVFDIEDRGAIGVPTERMVSLTEIFAGKLAESGEMRIVPRASLRALLLEAKKESYRECYDDACQIEIGKAVAAQRVVRSTIIHIGDVCAFQADVIDLRTELVERSSLQKGGCTEPALLSLVEASVGQLVSRRSSIGGGDTRSTPKSDTGRPAPSPDPEAELRSAVEAYLLEVCGAKKVTTRDGKTEACERGGGDSVVTYQLLGRFLSELEGLQAVLIVEGDFLRHNKFILMRRAVRPGSRWVKAGEVELAGLYGPPRIIPGPSLDQLLVLQGGTWQGQMSGGYSILRAKLVGQTLGFSDETLLTFRLDLDGSKRGVGVWGELVRAADSDADGLVDLEFAVDESAKDGSVVAHRVHFLQTSAGFLLQSPLNYRVPE